MSMLTEKYSCLLSYKVMCERMALHVYQQPSRILSMLESSRIIDEYTNVESIQASRSL